MAKKLVSTSAMIKRHTKSTKKLHSQVSKPAARKKVVKRIHHSLARDFNEGILASRGIIVQQSATAITLAHQNLVACLATTSNEISGALESDAVLCDQLSRPLGNEELQYTRGGLSTPSVVLRDQMERLARAVTIVDRETRKLQAELNEVTKEIDEAEKELLADMEGDGLTEQEMEREVVRLRVEVTNLCQSTVERMKESEKEMDVRSRKVCKDFLSAVGAEF